jgi:putative membrane protein
MPIAAGKPVDSATRLAFERTRLAHERTLTSWVRTATLFIAFGFTLYKFFEFQRGNDVPAAGLHLSPRLFAIAMIGTGLLALCLSALEYRRSMRQLRADDAAPRRSTAVVIALAVLGLGTLALVAALLRI